MRIDHEPKFKKHQLIICTEMAYKPCFILARVVENDLGLGYLVTFYEAKGTNINDGQLGVVKMVGYSELEKHFRPLTPTEKALYEAYPEYL